MSTEESKGPSFSGDADPSKSLEVVRDMDMITVPILVEPVSYEQSEERKLVRKFDWRIMPYLWGHAVLSAVDVN
jgi:hypothetical protein